MHAPGTAPVGLTLMGETLGDARLLALGRRSSRAHTWAKLETHR